MSRPSRTRTRRGRARRFRLLPLLFALTAACHDPPPGVTGERVLSTLVEDWRDEVIYQIVVDRFADGDRSNNVGVQEEHLGRYQGGDWRGIIDRIPYLQALGVTAVWLSPVVRNVESDSGFSAYHGYWTQDFYQVNPHFGDLGALQEMVDALHAADIKVILDLVVNHIGPLFYYDMNLNGQPDDTLFGGGGPSPGSQNDDVPGRLTRASEWDPDYDSRGIQAFSNLGEAGPAPVVWVYEPDRNRVPIQPAVLQDPTAYHRRGRITVWENPPALGEPPCEAPPQNNIELCDYVRQQEVLGDFPGGLKDLATERPEVQEALIQAAAHWIAVAGFDGVRLDAMKHLDHGFLRRFCPELRAHAAARGKQRLFIFGEVFSGADTLLSSYTRAEQADAVLYFSQMYTVINGVFQRGEPTAAIEALHADRVALYPDAPHPGGAGVAPADLLVNFIDNHDVARFLSAGTLPRLHLALTYLLTTVGVPCLYYGTEQQFDGANDPANREVLWRGNPGRGLAPYDTTNETFLHIAALTRLRREHAPLRRGDFTLRWSTQNVGDEEDAGLFAFERQHAGEGVLVVLNTAACTEAKRASRTRDEAGAMQTAFSAGTTLVNVLPGGGAEERFMVEQGGTVDVRVACEAAKILVPAR